MTTALQQVIDDDRLYFETFIEIEDRNRNPMKFQLNPAQEILHAQTTNRTKIVKASQLGSTTFYLARYLKRTITIPGTTSVVMAHEKFITQRLLVRTQYMYDKIPTKLKPVMHHKSSYEKSFPKINSVMYIGTAGADVFGRGEPIHNFLGSEYFYWPDPERILVPTMQRVPMDGEIVLESTPNGASGYAYDEIQKSIKGEDIWNVIALVWWLEPEYRIPRGSKHALPRDRGRLTYTGEEEALIRHIIAQGFKWTDQEAEDRMRWRRRKIREIGAFFWQEFIEDLISCFLTSGQEFYPADRVKELREGCYPAPFHFENASIWYPPDENATGIYVCTVDPGQGKVTRSVAHIWQLWPDYQEGGFIVRHEATLSGYYDCIAFAPLAMSLGRYYRTAKLIGEANGHGLAFSAEVKNYPNLYYRTDVVSGIPSKQIGWYTSGAAKIGSHGTKSFMLSSLFNLLPHLLTHDIDFVGEVGRVRYSGPNLVFGVSDDHHDAGAIMAATRNSVVQTGERGFIEESGFKW